MEISFKRCIVVQDLNPTSAHPPFYDACSFARSVARVRPPACHPARERAAAVMGCFSFLRRRPSDRRATRSNGRACCCICGCCPCGGREIDARAEARAGLEDIVRGFRRVARLELPPGAAHVLAKVRQDVMQLEAVIRLAELPKARPWIAPLAEEQRDWQALYPKAGELLRRQVCMAMECGGNDAEWSVGCLFIGECGIVFDSGEVSGDVARTGFISWDEIISLHKVGAGNAASELELNVIARGKLRLQLTIAKDMEWVEEFWKLCSTSPLPPVPSDDSDQLPTLPPESQKATTILFTPPVPKKGRLVSFQEEDLKEASPSRWSPSGVLRRRSISESIEGDESSGRRKDSILSLRTMSTASNVFVPERKDGSVPTAVVPEGDVELMGTERISGVTLDSIRNALENTGLLSRYVSEAFNAEDLAGTKWARSARVPGTLSRRFRFMMQLPKEVPRALQAIVKLPEKSNMTVVYRMRCTDDAIVLTSQCCTHEVTFGENFRVQETCYMRPCPEGGVELKKWTEIVWVAPLSWAFRSLQRLIESRAKGDSAKSIPKMAALLGEVTQGK